jgi:hypothetical protein
VGKGAISQSTLDTTISRDASAPCRRTSHIAHKKSPRCPPAGLACAVSSEDNMCPPARRWFGCRRSIRSGSIPGIENEMGRLSRKAEIELPSRLSR